MNTEQAIDVDIQYHLANSRKQMATNELELTDETIPDNKRHTYVLNKNSKQRYAFYIVTLKPFSEQDLF